MRPPSDQVMDLPAITHYVESRKLHPDPELARQQRERLRKITIHNAMTTQEVRSQLDTEGKTDRIEYLPPSSTEPHIWIPGAGELHVLNFRGNVRLIRDIDQAIVLSGLCASPVAISTEHHRGLARHASQRFRRFAFDLADRILAETPPVPRGAQGTLDLLIGPHQSLDIRGTRTVAQQENEYLNYRILRAGERTIINLDYIFADQALHVLSQLCSTLSADTIDGRIGKTGVRVFHYGKIGLLRDDLRVGDICVPYAAVDESRIAEGDIHRSPIPNGLDPECDPATAASFACRIGTAPYRVVTVNSISVLRQRRHALEMARDAGGDVIDMEWAAMASLIHGAKSAYPGIGRLRYCFAGIGSDRPLAGETLGDTTYPTDHERVVAKAMLDLIKEGPR